MADYEAPRYTVERSLSDDVEIRSYEPMLLAQVTVQGDRSGAGSEAFRILAGFIFGKNRIPEVDPAAGVSQQEENDAENQPLSEQRRDAPGDSTKIAMTVPVTQVAEGADAWTVSFMMPAIYTEATLPVPDDTRIQIHRTAAYRAVALSFSGRHSDANFDNHQQRLLQLIEREGFDVDPDPVLAYYNGPFTLPFLRRNEVMFVLNDR